MLLTLSVHSCVRIGKHARIRVVGQLCELERVVGEAKALFVANPMLTTCCHKNVLSDSGAAPTPRRRLGTWYG
jgi:hypothetical protein